MSDMPWIDEYETRTWKTYVIPAGSQDEPPLTPAAQDFVVCGAESQMAQGHYRATRHDPSDHQPFYYDLEQMAADLDNIYGITDLQVLSEDWRGHPAGTLVVTTFAGVTNTPPCFTYLVEAPQD